MTAAIGTSRESEAGHSDPTLGIMTKLAKALGVTVMIRLLE